MSTTNDARHREMAELLDLCMRIDVAAEQAYRALAASCEDKDLSRTLGLMADDEATHQQWWREISKAHDAGVLPELQAETDGLLESLREAAAMLESGRITQLASCDVNDVLEAAVDLEFYMLDPVFGELIELAEPAGTARHLAAYNKHLERLAGAVETHYTRNRLAAMLAGQLRRAWRDFSRHATLMRYDQLTHVLSRRALVGALDQWSVWSSRYRRPLSVVAIDVDHFKRINDTHGHEAGDLGLVALASALRTALRESDVLGRLGGDEFTIVAPETDGEALRTLLARIVEEVPRIAQRDWPFRETEPLSLSAGGAWTSGSPEVTAEQLMREADAALYRAKESGRGRAADPVHVGPHPSALNP